MERKVGEIFEYNGEWYQCIVQPKETEGQSCSICSMNFGGKCPIPVRECAMEGRSDGKSVIFKKLEKVGEPFVYEGKVLQRLRSIDGYSCVHCLFKEQACNFDSCDKDSFLVETELKLENMEEKKLNLKPFDLEAAKAGKPVCTRDGRKARIICFDAKCNKPIVALIYDCNKETVLQYLENGRFFVDQIDKYDLMMLPEKKEGWVNIFKDFEDTVCCVYPTEKEALEDGEIEKDYITTIKIEWEE